LFELLNFGNITFALYFFAVFIAFSLPVFWGFSSILLLVLFSLNLSLSAAMIKFLSLNFVVNSFKVFSIFPASKQAIVGQFVA
tara:strand:+ start:237 stop:485 length:249 start_codon:yes stop_codon:yes gene_type:complete